MKASPSMWIPGPIYESLPYIYIIGGVLFISGTIYVGLESAAAPLYIACGLVSIVYGAVVFSKRQTRRQNSANGDSVNSA